jgi:hypothetical protein
MNSYRVGKPGQFFVFASAAACLFWVAAADPARSNDPVQQVSVTESPEFHLAEGCPYPDGRQASQGLDGQGFEDKGFAGEGLEGKGFAGDGLEEQGAEGNEMPPLLVIPELRYERSPIRPAVFYETYIPDEKADNPKLII